MACQKRRERPIDCYYRWRAYIRTAHMSVDLAAVSAALCRSTRRARRPVRLALCAIACPFTDFYRSVSSQYLYPTRTHSEGGLLRLPAAA